MDFTRIKIIFTDLDGTLLPSDGEVSDCLLRGIERLAERGVLVVPTTGRSFGATNEKLRNCPHLRYMICSNGAVCYDLVSGEKTEKLLEGEPLERAKRVFLDYHQLFCVHADGNDWVPDEDRTDEAMDRCEINDYYRSFIKNHTVSCGTREDLIKMKRVEFFGGFFKNSEDIDSAWARLAEIEGVAVSSAAKNLLEVINPTAGKGNAVLELAARLGVSPDEFITVGDSQNDASMMDITPNSFAMESGAEALKTLANYIACPGEGGLIEYLEALTVGSLCPKKANF